MKNSFKILLAALVFTMAFTMALTPLVHADDQPHQMPPDNSSAELNRIKSLEGRWVSKTSMFGKKDEKVFTEFEVTSNGSAVLEKIFPGTPHEMVSVYYDDEKGKLNMTHYCIMRNRPQLKLAKSDGDILTMDVAKVEGLKSKNDPSMGEVTIEFKDKNHFASTCRGRGKGAEDQPPMTMEYTRVR